MARRCFIEEIKDALKEKDRTLIQIQEEIINTPTKEGRRRKTYPSVGQLGNYLGKNPKLFKKTGEYLNATCMRGHGKGYPQPLWTLTK